MKKKIKYGNIENIFRDNSRSHGDNHRNETLTGPSITKDEIKRAINIAKTKKAAGPDELLSEIIKLIDDENIPILEKVFNHIYNSGTLPDEWLKSTFMAIPKINNAKKCNDHRLISLMSHMLKIFLKIIHNRLFKKCEANMGELQFGFKEAMGTREALFCTQILVQKCNDVKKDVFICFIDYEKAFDTIQHDKLIEILQTIGLDTKDIRIIKNLYWNQSAVLKINDVLAENLTIQRGVRQGCILSPLLFNLYSEQIFKEAINEIDSGIKVNGKYINNIRYADDTTVIADSPEDLQTLLNRINEASLRAGLKMNAKKTKFMIISRNKTPYDNVAIKISNKIIERVHSFKYLGSWLYEKWDSNKEINCRIEMARSTFFKFKKILCNNQININLRLRYMKCYVWSVLLYGVETWTLKATNMNRLESFEIWCYRRMLRISWTDRLTNEEVLSLLNKDRELIRLIKIRKTSYFGHIMRGSKYEQLQLILQGKIEGRRGRGRKQMSWLQNIKEWTGIFNINHLITIVRSRTDLSNLVNNI